MIKSSLAREEPHHNIGAKADYRHEDHYFARPRRRHGMPPDHSPPIESYGRALFTGLVAVAIICGAMFLVGQVAEGLRAIGWIH
jgi:hypothetical protein